MPPHECLVFGRSSNTLLEPCFGVDYMRGKMWGFFRAVSTPISEIVVSTTILHDVSSLLERYFLEQIAAPGAFKHSELGSHS